MGTELTLTLAKDAETSTLTEEQEAIVSCRQRHFKVLSAAGSGKTTVLTSRISRLCTDGANAACAHNKYLTLQTHASRWIKAIRSPLTARSVV
jgi:Ni2+-binding GTPase involved in maturation of urease and hydrogenase